MLFLVAAHHLQSTTECETHYSRTHAAFSLYSRFATLFKPPLLFSLVRACGVNHTEPAWKCSLLLPIARR